MNKTMIFSVPKEDLDATGRVMLDAGRWCKIFYSDGETRPRGKWLNKGTVFWQCDQCLERYTGRTKKIPNFCPNCGADMREEEQYEC